MWVFGIDFVISYEICERSRFPWLIVLQSEQPLVYIIEFESFWGFQHQKISDKSREMKTKDCDSVWSVFQTRIVENQTLEQNWGS
jgi:hypothetical protein